MKTEDRIQKQRLLVEEIGLGMDKEGFPRISGRILALLMVMDKEQYTFDEIVEELGISKSSASVALKNLELRGNVEYITHPGDRKRYFRIKAKDPFVMIDDFSEKLKQFQTLQAKIISLKADQESRNAKFFKELNEIIEFVLSHTDELKTQYKKIKS
jgi:DNA-binding transcriptional regulator GbsR (MarR family)